MNAMSTLKNLATSAVRNPRVQRYLHSLVCFFALSIRGAFGPDRLFECLLCPRDQGRRSEWRLIVCGTVVLRWSNSHQ